MNDSALNGHGDRFGTLTLASSLNMSGGGACYLDLSDTYSSGNDRIVVNGALTLGSGTVFHINALSGAADLDTTGDYVLVSGSSTPSGTVDPLPVWDGTMPANGANYAVMISGNNVVLHYATAPPLGITSATASPSSITRYQSTLLSVTVANGAPPFTVTVDASSIGAGAVTLYTNAATGDFTNTITPADTTVVGGHSLPVSVTDSLSSNAESSIALTVTGSSLTWDGTVSGDWDTSAANWQGGEVYQQGDFTRFDDTLGGTPSVNLAIDATPGGITVSNTAALPSAEYTFSGSGSLGGSAGLTKQGSGTLIVDNSGVNSFSGGVTISGGTLQVGNDDANGNLPGAITDNSVLIYDRSDVALNVSNVISGTGSVTYAGSGTVSNSGMNTYTGNTTITNGTLKAGSSSALGATNVSVIVSSGATLDDGGQNLSAYTNITVSGGGVNGNGAIVNNGAAQTTAFGHLTLAGNTTFGGSNRWDLRLIGGSLLTGGQPYSITKVGTNQVTLVHALTIDPALSNIVIQAGVFGVQEIGAFNGLGTNGAITVFSNATLEVDYSETLTNYTKPIIMLDGATLLCEDGVNNIDDPVTLSTNVAGGPGNCIFNITGNSMTLSNVVSGPGNLIMTGSSNLVLTAANTYSGNTVISAGTLTLSGSGSIADSANISLGSGALFNVSGLSTAFALGGNQTLSNNAAATGTLNGNVGTGSGTVALTYASGTPSFNVTGGTLTLSASTIFNFNNVGATLAHGRYQLIAVGTGGAVAVADNLPAVTVSGSGIVNTAGEAATLQITGGELNLVVNAPPVTGPTFTLGVILNVPSTVQIIGGKYAPTDADGDVLTVTSVSGAVSGTVTTDGMNVTYTATNGAAASDSFTYTVSDGYGGTATGTVNITISTAVQGYNQVSLQMIGGNAVLTYLGIPGYDYALDWTHSLTPPITWTPLVTNTAAGNGFLNYTNTPSGGSDFYRTRYVP
jgi:autotransporter-associated beta strand protein